ncbi:MAG: hypothetical protein ACKVWR_06545 [Acidimicrobiales bacterium]
MSEPQSGAPAEPGGVEEPPPGEQRGGAGRAEVVDELPAELNASEFVGPYVFPDNSRRRIPGFIYLAIAAGLVALWALAGRDAVLVNGGMLLAAGLLAAAGLYHLQAGWPLAVDENDALVAATAEVGFPVGHASAQMGWRGLRSRPTWRILLYSADDPPTKRGLVMVDGVDGGIVERIVEDNPEDWSEYADAFPDSVDPDSAPAGERPGPPPA